MASDPKRVATSAAHAVISESVIDGAAIGAISQLVERDDCGAVVLFLGNVRNHHQDRAVDGITYTAYKSMAEQRLQRIVAELTRPSLQLAIHHRIGRLLIGETSVVIAAASAHREEAYAASRQALERLKTEVPIWKREHYTDGASTWREEESLLGG